MLTEALISALPAQPFRPELTDLASVGRQQYDILRLLVHLLDVLSSAPLQNEVERAMAVSVLAQIRRLGVPVSYLLDYATSSGDELSYVGLCCFFYVLRVEGIEGDLWPSIYMPGYALQASLPYMTAALQFTRSSGKALALLDRLLSFVLPASVNHREANKSFWSDFAQTLINFMVNCPADAIRSRAYTLMGRFITIFDDTTRFDLLLQLISSCPYTSAVSLLLYRFKQVMMK